MSAAIEGLLKALQHAVASQSLYPPEHPQIQDAADRALGFLREATARRSGISVFAIEDRIVYEGRPLTGVEAVNLPFLETLREAGYDRLTLRRGTSPAELAAFIGALAAAGKRTGEGSKAEVRPSRNIRLSALQGEGSEGLDRGFLAEEVDTLQDVWTDIVERGDLNLDAIEGIVMALAKTVEENLGAMIPMAALKSHDRYTATHITNVALLAMALAEAIELPPDRVHDVGIAALLHDVGKLKVPSEILNKPDRLNPEQLECMKRHPEDGARMLLATPGVPDLAVVVAYEHHVRFDGGGYPVLPRSWKPSLASAVTQVADVYDALRTDRPYRTGLDRDTIMAMMTADAGITFEPALLAAFFELVVPRAASS
ncbi:MAG TPA: HD domain-containing phosphohydrolase [Vicinamibacteria bacterium]